MRHVLRRHAIAEAQRSRLLCEAVYSGAAPVFCGESGLAPFRSFLARCTAVIDGTTQAESSSTNEAELRAFDQIAARARR